MEGGFELACTVMEGGLELASFPGPKRRRKKDLGMRLGCYQGDYSVDTLGLSVSLSALVCLSTWCLTISGGER